MYFITYLPDASPSWVSLPQFRGPKSSGSGNRAAVNPAVFVLALFRERSSFAVEHPFLAVTEGFLALPQIVYHRLHALRLQAERLVGALPGPVEREMLLDDARAERVGHRGHRNARIVRAPADDFVRELFSQGGNYP
jgi:hypothetical protein